MSRSKNPKRVAAGQAGALVRWGPPGTRTVRLDDLEPSVRSAIVALVEAARKATRKVADNAA